MKNSGARNHSFVSFELKGVPDPSARSLSTTLSRFPDHICRRPLTSWNASAAQRFERPKRKGCESFLAAQERSQSRGTLPPCISPGPWTMPAGDKRGHVEPNECHDHGIAPSEAPLCHSCCQSIHSPIQRVHRPAV